MVVLIIYPLLFFFILYDEIIINNSVVQNINFTEYHRKNIAIVAMSYCYHHTEKYK